VKIWKIAAALIGIALVANGAVNVMAQTPEKDQAAQDLRDAEAVCQRHRAELMKIPHVRVVTGEVDGQNEAAILVEVDDQKNIDSVTREVPSQLEGFPVEIDEGAPDDEVGFRDEAGHGGNVAPTPTPPTIDKNGYYHHTWAQPSAPATKPDAQP
jgi:hypothetical protein